MYSSELPSSSVRIFNSDDFVSSSIPSPTQVILKKITDISKGIAVYEMTIIYKCIYLNYEFLARIQRAEEIAEEKGQDWFQTNFPNKATPSPLQS